MSTLQTTSNWKISDRICVWPCGVTVSLRLPVPLWYLYWRPLTRIILPNAAYQLHRILPTKTDPLVSLMMVEKVPDSTYEMVGGLDKQIKEIKEVIELRERPYMSMLIFLWLNRLFSCSRKAS